MSLTSLLTKEASLRYELTVGKDEYGQPTTRRVDVPTTCYYRLQNTSIGDAVYQADERIRVTLAPSTDIDGLKGVSIDGVDYELAGVPHLQWNPRSKTVQYVQVQVRKAAS
jgi:hypothetical protein